MATASVHAAVPVADKVVDKVVDKAATVRRDAKVVAAAAMAKVDSSPA